LKMLWHRRPIEPSGSLSSLRGIKTMSLSQH